MPSHFGGRLRVLGTAVCSDLLRHRCPEVLLFQTSSRVALILVALRFPMLLAGCFPPRPWRECSHISTPYGGQVTMRISSLLSASRMSLLAQRKLQRGCTEIRLFPCLVTGIETHPHPYNRWRCSSRMPLRSISCASHWLAPKDH